MCNGRRCFSFRRLRVGRTKPEIRRFAVSARVKKKLFMEPGRNLNTVFIPVVDYLLCSNYFRTFDTLHTIHKTDDDFNSGHKTNRTPAPGRANPVKLIATYAPHTIYVIISTRFRYKYVRCLLAVIAPIPTHIARAVPLSTRSPI